MNLLFSRGKQNKHQNKAEIDWIDENCHVKDLAEMSKRIFEENAPKQFRFDRQI
jgi:hypothetical protein